MTQTLALKLDVHPHPPASFPEGGSLSSVGKSLQILNSFRGSGVLLGVSQIAERAEVSKSTAHRLLAVLVEHGFVEKRDGRYMLGRSIFELGNLTADTRPRSLRENAMPFMVDLYKATDATVHLAVLDGSDVLYIEKIYGHAAVPLPSRVGGRVPALCTALGKALLAYTPPDERDSALANPVPRLTPYTVVDTRVLQDQIHHVRAHGYAVDQAGSSIAAQCFAAPILDSRSRAVAAVSMTIPVTSTVSTGALRELMRAATGIGRTLTS
ncbi:IclR family transcriptional regulator [Dactylosporangium sp. NPDC048998]|uniref:IclR family transcriptional regulator n=1 Tax=Dactylosporangium sp. NPDC048998 TaxID=3363976 RepID=UPI003723C82F